MRLFLLAAVLAAAVSLSGCLNPHIEICAQPNSCPIHAVTNATVQPIQVKP